jgi:hypothetical protein
MASCAVIDLQTNKQLNYIVAEKTDVAPNGCKLVEIPNGYYWDETTGQLTVVIDAVEDISNDN